ncbi:2-oxo-4-hydroxy-4-carboxy-5-ureidoimidazoline decarboxylase [Nocardia puris]|uniref:2-oxo-4-hydroxy-4-carboxy-5-ureidoimidazoline decarboxylase n=1 Tax=Nocardia puris TaxID=208602 RepID=A0A366DMH5_9NOCA|nr:2-oxo-4-hydroxy-4-carboxy-5-ureidoimidazoline decarboxylase [Nocardia puris]MBF6211286.1 2-oxo-4-hydroxy-4-carboxy-5-ureidoimidazoline decarboxylase [Nocardia puris]MBF6365005.1 2-oxo-4-hydroxy-4-carboxy-5-ureidoimidazoline decarboxylase [Nocardia puris]MBF6458790.1 2-oxo-4-hydroxy-4-carboxy-5-ureidoimidazoline decarboxylase [Nocardia puris]RBO90639.1 2-oxo-4-hydroxy-4-carboxy-5-ureidoimidazoline decarboxylase [Nocardia puris]
MTDDDVGIGDFDALAQDAATAALLACCSSPAWARGVLAGRPYGSVDRLFAAADAVLAELPESEIDAALAGHPRIGDTPDNAASAREQAGVADSGDEVRAALAAGNREYEERFGHLYLVCASGRSGPELLEVLRARLGNDPATERQVMRTELAKINRIRLARMLGGAS